MAESKIKMQYKGFEVLNCAVHKRDLQLSNVKGFSVTLPDASFNTYYFIIFTRYSMNLARVEMDGNGTIYSFEINHLTQNQELSATTDGNTITFRESAWNTYTVILITPSTIPYTTVAQIPFTTIT